MTANLLHAHALTVCSPGGRTLFRELTLILDRGDRVALVGRNGVGKSTLLSALAGSTVAESGAVACFGKRLLVPQGLELPVDRPSLSAGEARRRRLQQALDERPDLLLLDEPTQDLDQAGLDWLVRSLRGFPNALLVASHDLRLLDEFRDFFVAAEGGCHHFSGTGGELIAALRREQQANETGYGSELERLAVAEQRRFHIRQRWQRKKNVGRIRELARGTPKIRLNAKRSYAQEKQAKRLGIQADRSDAARTWARTVRRSLAVELPLAAVLPQLAEPSPYPVVRLSHVSARAGQRVLFEDLSLELGRQRLAVSGPSGSGKSTLLELLAGARAPEHGRAQQLPERIGYIAQNAANWCGEASLLERLLQEVRLDPDAAASCMRAHQFPFALAQRPLASLSPGERLRAALICLLQRSPPELLILDEPTSHLDFVGYHALEALLAKWPGGLVVASHNREFLSAIRLEQRLSLHSAPS